MRADNKKLAKNVFGFGDRSLFAKVGFDDRSFKVM